MRRVTPMSDAFPICVLAAITLASACHWSAVSAAQTGTGGGGPSPEYARLQQEQLAALREAATTANQLLLHGAISNADANRLNHLLVEAELAAATSAQERGRVLKAALDAARKEEDRATRQFEAGMVSGVVPLEAKAYRIGIQLKLSDVPAK